MRKIILFAVALLSLSTASAWNKFAQECIATLAYQNLTPQAKEQTTALLGGDLASASWWLQTLTQSEQTKYTGSWHFTTVTADLKSTTKSAKDGVVQIERCADILRNRAEHSDSTVVAALRSVIHLVADVHNISHIRIEGCKHSRTNFKFRLSNGKPGKKEVISDLSWRKLWESSLIGRHSCYSPAMFADDLQTCYGEQKENFSRGDIRHWVEDMATLAAPLYQWAAPDFYMSREHINRLEPLNDKSMARAGYRLAALLNDIFE
ncbi:MAG: hypothetical protein IJX65_00670 [Alistipes sp.]|nr:hypothetical protein [Alistipes sp.]